MNNNSYIKLYKSLLPHLKGRVARLCIVIIALTCVSLSLMAFGHVLNKLIDALSGNERTDLYFGQLLGLIIIFSLASFVRSYNINHIAADVTYDVKMSVFKHLMHLLPYVIGKYSASDIHSRLTKDMDKIHKLIVDSFSFLLRNSIMLLGSIILMFLENAKLAMIAFMGIGLLLLIISQLSRVTKKLARQMQHNDRSLSMRILEALQNFKILYALSIASDYAEEQQQKVERYLYQAKDRYKHRALFFASSIAGILVLILLVCYIGVGDIDGGQTTAGSMIAFLFFAIMAAFSLGGIIENAAELEANMLAISRVLELQELPRLDSDSVRGQARELTAITLQNIEFTYPDGDDKSVLNGCSLSIPCQGMNAIVGPSGSGKTSVIRLLMGFCQQQQGEILWDGKVPRLSDMRAQFTYCPQEPMLFSLSIKDNICLGVEFDAQRFKKVIQITGVDEVIKLLSDGEDAQLFDAGSNLSGGQRQRIAIARALYRQDVPILILDEATSSLDAESERGIMHAIRDAELYQSIICITHRIANIKDADQIFVLHKGELEAQGMHRALLKESKLYQLLNYEA